MDDNIALKIEYLPINRIKPSDKNARKHGGQDVDAIAASIKKFGFDDPIGIWGEKNIIVEGHGRLMAAKKLGMQEVPVIRLDHLNDEERRAYALAHNKTAELSAWDLDTLNNELEDLGDMFDMSELGFIAAAPVSMDDLDAMFTDGPQKSGDDKPLCKCPKCGFEFRP